jgi:LPS-assembly lipoprotein
MRHLFLSLALVGLAACGFQPVYAPSGGSLAGQSTISVEPIKGRAGHVLRRALQQELAIGLPGVTQSATLNVVLDEDLTRLAFQPDGAASRSSVIAYGRYVLASESGAVNGSVDVETSFNVPDSPFGDISAQSGASDRAMRLLAKKIVDDLRLQLAAR